jgi:hypothetical protein
MRGDIHYVREVEDLEKEDIWEVWRYGLVGGCLG